MDENQLRQQAYDGVAQNLVISLLHQLQVSAAEIATLRMRLSIAEQKLGEGEQCES